MARKNKSNEKLKEAAEKKKQEEELKEKQKEEARQKAAEEAKKNKGKVVYKNGRASIKVSASELKKFQDDGRLVGYDPVNQVALIKAPEEVEVQE